MPAPPWPRISEGAVFRPWQLARGGAHVAVDCAPAEGTVLVLSHWPAAGTPARWEDDTSALIADRYLRDPPSGDAPAVDVLTCDHYDEDGLFALWLLLERPAEGSPERALAIAGAAAGDFGTWTDPRAAWVALAAMRMAERGTTPFPDVARVLATARDRDPAGDLYAAVLPRVGRLLRDPERFRLLWAPDWERITADIALLDAGEARIREVPAADLAIVEAPRPLHDMAVHPRTGRMRILTARPDGALHLRHRYETWVRYVSRPLPARVDLAGLARRLQRLERNPGTWVAEDMAVIRPMTYLRGPRGGPAPSSIGPDRFAEELAATLARGGAGGPGLRLGAG